MSSSSFPSGKVTSAEVDLALCPHRRTDCGHWRVDGTCACQPSLDSIAEGASLPAAPAPTPGPAATGEPQQQLLIFEH